MSDGASAFTGRTLEDTVADPEQVPVETAHRHFDEIAQEMEPGSRLPSTFQGIEGAQ